MIWYKQQKGWRKSLYFSANDQPNGGNRRPYCLTNSLIPRYQENRDLLYRGLPKIFLGDHAPSDGAFYLYADVSAFTDDWLRSQRILAETGVAITPGVDFDPYHGKTHVRLSYAGSTKEMKKAIQRINAWLAKT